MPSKKPCETLEFLGEIPTTSEDVASLRAIRKMPTGLDPWTEMQLLHDALPEAAKKPRRNTSEGFEPFEL